MITPKNGKKGWSFDGKVRNLLRNRSSGQYYGRFKISGKQKWINLDTNDRSIAALKINDERKKIINDRLNGVSIGSGTATMGTLFDALLKKIDQRAGISETTKEGYRGAIRTLRETWPNIDAMNPRKITRAAVEEWRDKIAVSGTGRQSGRQSRSAKHTTRVKGNSASWINKCINVLRQVMEMAVESGQLARNTVDGRGLKLPMDPKKVKLPDQELIEKILREIELRAEKFNRRHHTAGFCRFLAYSGARLAEVTGKDRETGEIVNPIRWCDVHLEKGLIHIRGTKTDAADRWVPIFKEMRDLLEGMRTELLAHDGAINPTARLFKIVTGAAALRNACKALGAPKLTHHDLRDHFATTCIESGVPIPTVAAWMGHADGGALLMKVYTHHRGTHSVKAAKSVSFSGASSLSSTESATSMLLTTLGEEIAKNGPGSPGAEKLMNALKALGISDPKAILPTVSPLTVTK